MTKHCISLLYISHDVSFARKIYSQSTVVLYMSFDKFLLAVESRDLSQADKSIIRVSSFPSFNLWMINYSYTQKKLFGTWQFGKIDVLVNFITQKFQRLKSKHFSQFFWWEVNLRGLRAFILQKVQASVVERQKKKLCYPSVSFGKEDTLIILLSAWDRSRDSTTKWNLSKDMWRT